MQFSHKSPIKHPSIPRRRRENSPDQELIVVSNRAIASTHLLLPAPQHCLSTYTKRHFVGRGVSIDIFPISLRSAAHGRVLVRVGFRRNAPNGFTLEKDSGEEATGELSSITLKCAAGVDNVHSQHRQQNNYSRSRIH